MKRHTPEELGRIFQEFAGKGLWVPLPQSGTEIEVGPLAMVYIRWSEVAPKADTLEDTYWDTLQGVPRLGALGVLALIDNILVMGGLDIEVHRTLNERFLSNNLKANVAEYKLEQLPPPARRAFPVVFNRLGCLLLMRHLILYGADLDGDIDAPIENVGELALFANEFVQRDTLPTGLGKSSSELPLQFVPIWDIYNPGDLAYALPRMFTILTEILPGADKEVRKFTAKLGMDPSSLTISGIGLVDFISVVFGLYAFGNKVREVGKDAVVFDYKRVFEKAPAMLPAVENFLRERCLTLTQFRERFGAEKSGSRQALSDEIKERSFLASGLDTFRHFPLLKLDDTRTVVLDLQFLFVKDYADNTELARSWLTEKIVEAGQRIPRGDHPLTYADIETAGKAYIDSLDSEPDKDHARSADLKRELSELTHGGLLLQGAEIRCELCMSKFWYHVDEIGKLVDCKGCRASIPLPAELEWSYQPNELLRAGVRYHGLVPVLRTIRRLFKQAHECFIFAAGVKLYEYKENKPVFTHEVDLCWIKDGQFGIAEVKQSTKLFSTSDYERLVEIACIAKPDVVLIAATEGQDQELEAGGRRLNAYLTEKGSETTVEVWGPARFTQHSLFG